MCFHVLMCVTCVNDICVNMLIAVCENITIMIQWQINPHKPDTAPVHVVTFTANHHLNGSLLTCSLPSLCHSPMKISTVSKHHTFNKNYTSIHFIKRLSWSASWRAGDRIHLVQSADPQVLIALENPSTILDEGANARGPVSSSSSTLSSQRR